MTKRDFKIRIWIEEAQLMNRDPSALLFPATIDEQDKYGFVIEEYTGVTCSYGFDIYNGDVLVDDDDGIVMGAVTYADGMYTVGDNWLIDAASHGHVVGNIHENLELLEV
ncbi:YopX family protein [Weissella tructae]|uniref:YopX family protein n=1 Tax=Weissella tructae TaxID=887702 RepID=UPI003D89C328